MSNPVEIQDTQVQVTDQQADIEEAAELLDEIGLDFALHAHHPLTHLEAEDGSAAEREAKTRSIRSL